MVGQMVLLLLSMNTPNMHELYTQCKLSVMVAYERLRCLQTWPHLHEALGVTPKPSRGAVTGGHSCIHGQLSLLYRWPCIAFFHLHNPSKSNYSFSGERFAMASCSFSTQRCVTGCANRRSPFSSSNVHPRHASAAASSKRCTGLAGQERLFVARAAAEEKGKCVAPATCGHCQRVPCPV